MFVTSAHAEEAAQATTGETQPATTGTEAHGAAVGDAHTTGTEVEHGKGVFPPFDSSTYPSQILWLAITFGLFYLFLKKVIVPRLSHILEVRSDKIAQDLDQAAKAKADADAAVAAYEQELAEARAKANSIGQTARDAAKTDAEKHRKTLESQLEEKLAAAETRIAGIKSKAMGDVGSIAESTAAAIVEQLLGGKSDKAAIATAVKAVRS